MRPTTPTSVDSAGTPQSCAQSVALVLRLKTVGVHRVVDDRHARRQPRLIGQQVVGHGLADGDDLIAVASDHERDQFAHASRVG